MSGDTQSEEARFLFFPPLSLHCTRRGLATPTFLPAGWCLTGARHVPSPPFFRQVEREDRPVCVRARAPPFPEGGEAGARPAPPPP